jgi:hypothetical protein
MTTTVHSPLDQTQNTSDAQSYAQRLSRGQVIDHAASEVDNAQAHTHSRHATGHGADTSREQSEHSGDGHSSEGSALNFPTISPADNSAASAMGDSVTQAGSSSAYEFHPEQIMSKLAQALNPQEGQSSAAGTQSAETGSASTPAAESSSSLGNLNPMQLVTSGLSEFSQGFQQLSQAENTNSPTSQNDFLSAQTGLDMAQLGLALYQLDNNSSVGPSGTPSTSSGEAAAVAGTPNTSSGEAAAVTGTPNTSTGEAAAVAGTPSTSSGEAAAVAGTPSTSSGEAAAVAGTPNTSSGEAAGSTGASGTTVNLGDATSTGTGVTSTTGGDTGTTVSLGSSTSSGNAGFIAFFGGDTDAQEADSISQALGKTVVPSSYLDWTQPAAQTTQYNIGQYASWVAANPGKGMVLGVPLTYDGQSLASTANGSNDAEFTQMAQQLVAAGQGNDTIRLGVEMNGPWATDNYDGNPQDFINAYNNAAEAMKAVPGANFSFDWNPANGEYNNIPVEDYYPGSANVNSIGVDVYDQDWGNTNATPAQTWNTLTTEAGGLNELAAFAQTEGKPFSIPEYAVAAPYGQAGNANAGMYGSGDDASFINNIADFLNTQANAEGVAFQSYFDSPSGGVGTTLETSPNSYNAYVQDFSNGGVDGAEK